MQSGSDNPVHGLDGGNRHGMMFVAKHAGESFSPCVCHDGMDAMVMF